MKCEIIKDLLPAYCDCVCSLETAAEIEQHTASCENCKKLLEDYRSDIEPLNKGEPEKPFRKIKRGIFRSKFAIVLLIIILAGVLCTIGYLTYGQIVRSPNHPSFETIISSQKAKKLAKKFCEGDIDYVMENIEIYQTSYILYSTQEEIREHCQNALTKFYDKNFSGKNLNVTADQYSGYEWVLNDNVMIPYTEIQIWDGNSEILHLNICERNDGNFLINVVGCDTAISESDIGELDLALNPIEPSPFIEAISLNTAKEKPDHFELLYARHYADTDEEKQQLLKNAAALTEDMYCEKAFYSDFRFDKENSRYLIDIGYIFSEKSSGKRAVYYHTMWVTSYYHFEVLPEFEPVIIDDGISAKSREKLENLFIY